MSLVKTTNKGSVNIGWSNFPIWSDDNNAAYENCGRYYIETYMVPGAVGEWELEILPKNADTFDYSIIIGDSD